jgi:hypothetical protein
MIVAAPAEERGSPSTRTCSGRRVARGIHVDRRTALPIDFCGSSTSFRLYVVDVTVRKTRKIRIRSSTTSKFSLDLGKLAFHRLRILSDNHEKPYQRLVYDLAVTYHVANDAQSSRSVDKSSIKKFNVSVVQ